MSEYRREIAVGGAIAVAAVIVLASAIAYLPFASSPGRPSPTTSHTLSGLGKTSTEVDCTPFTTIQRSSVACQATVAGDPPTGEIEWSAYATSGTVVFSSTSCTLLNGSCSVNMTATPTGSLTVKAEYLGDTTDASSVGVFVPAVVTTQFRGSPVAVAVNPSTGLVYVANGGSVVFVVNATTNTIVDQIQGVVSGTTLAVDPMTDMIYVGSFADEVTVINGSSNSVMAHITLGGKNGAVFDRVYGVAIDADTGTLYVLMTHPGYEELKGSVIAVNATSYSILGNLTNAALGSNYDQLAVDSSLDRVYLLQDAGPCVFNGTGSTCGNDGVVTVANGALTRILSNVTVSSQPANGIAVDPVTHVVYVSVINGLLSVINGSTDETVTNITVGASPSAVSVNVPTNTIYVGNEFSGTVSVINGSTDKVVATVTGAKAGTGQAVAADPTGEQVYVSNNFGGTVSVIDSATNVIKTTIYGWGSPNSASVDPVTDRVYLGLGDSSFVPILNGSDGSVIANVPLAQPNASYTSGTDAVVNQATGLVYATSFGTDNISVIDGFTGAIVGTIDLGRPLIQSISADPLTDRIYVVGLNSTGTSCITATNCITVWTSTVWVIDGSTNKILAEVPISGYASTIAINPNTNLLYVSSSWTSITPEHQAVNNGTVFIVSGSTNTVVGQLEAGAGGDDSFAVDPTTNVVYVSRSASIYVVNGSTNQVEGTIQITGLGSGVAVDSDTGLLYACRFQQKYDRYSVVVINASEYSAVPNGQKQIVSTNSTISGNATAATAAANATGPDIIESITISSCGSVAINPASHVVYVVGGSNFSVVEILGLIRTPS